METILTALRKAGKTGGTIAEALGGSTIAAGVANATTTATAYVVSFSATGGSGSVSPIACAKGATVTLPDSTGLTPPSTKEFKGWGTKADATSVIRTYAATADATLYAIWEAAE